MPIMIHQEMGCTGLHWTSTDLGTQIRLELDPNLRKTCFGITDKTNGVSNAVNCYKEAVQFSVSFVMSRFASF